MLDIIKIVILLYVKNAIQFLMKTALFVQKRNVLSVQTYLLIQFQRIVNQSALKDTLLILHPRFVLNAHKNTQNIVIHVTRMNA